MYLFKLGRLNFLICKSRTIFDTGNWVHQRIALAHLSWNHIIMFHYKHQKLQPRRRRQLRARDTDSMRQYNNVITNLDMFTENWLHRVEPAHLQQGPGAVHVPDLPLPHIDALSGMLQHETAWRSAANRTRPHSHYPPLRVNSIRPLLGCDWPLMGHGTVDWI